MSLKACYILVLCQRLKAIHLHNNLMIFIPQAVGQINYFLFVSIEESLELKISSIWGWMGGSLRGSFWIWPVISSPPVRARIFSLKGQELAVVQMLPGARFFPATIRASPEIAIRLHSSLSILDHWALSYLILLAQMYNNCLRVSKVFEPDPRSAA